MDLPSNIREEKYSARSRTADLDPSICSLFFFFLISSELRFKYRISAIFKMIVNNCALEKDVLQF